MGRRDHPSSAADPKLCASIPGAGSCVGRNWVGAGGFLVLMTRKRTTNRSAARRIVALLAFAGLCAALTAAIGMSTAGAKKATVIGKTKSTPPPSCPNLKNQSLCQVVGRTTGYMTVASGQKHPFNVFKDGKIVAWAIDLSKPANSKKAPQRSYFGSLFENKDWGTHPTARLSILKRKEKHKFKLLKQTPVVDLQHEMGEKQVITLDKPLHVHPGQVVALSYPTWAPDFASAVSTSQNKWRASRKKDNCAPKGSSDAAKQKFARNSHAHQKVGTTRSYDCNYTGGRLLYWAYFVPSKKK